MPDFLAKLLKTDFLPHGVCYRWQSDVVWLHVVSDLLIALAYYFIPLGLIYIIRRRTDLVFPWMFWLFGIFIMACGTTHLMSVWTVWQPVYRLDGIVKLITAMASVPTAILLMRLAPKVVELPSPEQLRQANQRLEKEIADRMAAEAEVRSLNSELERRVEERTRELAEANQRLRESEARLKQSNAELEQFNYVAAHDLQEPLRNVKTYTQMLGRKYREQLDSGADIYINFITGGVDRMELLIKDLHVYSRLSYRLDISGSVVNAGDVLRETLRDVEVAIRETGAQVQIDQMCEVRANRTQLGQVFQNLTTNALKYRSERPLRLRYSCRQKTDVVEFTVEDNGIGLDMRYSGQIFGLFKRLHGREIPGTGIGLAICKKVVEAHGGTIWVDSTPGQGTAFHFTLPAV